MDDDNGLCDDEGTLNPRDWYLTYAVSPSPRAGYRIGPLSGMTGEQAFRLAYAILAGCFGSDRRNPEDLVAEFTDEQIELLPLHVRQYLIPIDDA